MGLFLSVWNERGGGRNRKERVSPKNHKEPEAHIYSQYYFT